MAVQIGAKLDSGFGDPLGMLTDCHRRIERFLDVLCNVAQRAHERELTSEEAAAVESALRYFREGGQRHTRDEEESLFPRLNKAAPAEKLAPVEHLRHEHREADDLHARLDRIFSGWIAAGPLNAQDREALLSGTTRLHQLYAEHIQAEEKVVFPMAAQVLGPEDIAEMGEEFRARRR